MLNSTMHSGASINAEMLAVDHSSKAARIVTGFFFLALFVDYYGGLGIKYIAFTVGILWVLQYRHSLRIFRRVGQDLFVLLFLPLALMVLHIYDNVLLSSKEVTFTQYISGSYSAISSSTLLILYPLFSYVGTSAIWKQIVTGFRVVSVAVLVIYALNVTGVIDVVQFQKIATEYRIGVFARDPRLLQDAFIEQSQKVNAFPFVAYAMLLTLGYEVTTSSIAASLIFVALLVSGERGLIIGGVVLMISAVLLSTRVSLKKAIKKYVLFVLLMMVVVLSSEAIRYRISGVFMKRTSEMFEGQDPSTLLRLGHIEGYINLLAAQPAAAFVGAGPMAEIYNPFLHEEIKKTEMSVLNDSIHFGIPLAIILIFWRYRAAFKLWIKRGRPDFRREDMALILGASIFWLVGNTNPLMDSPFSMIAFMLISLRTIEISNRRSASLGVLGGRL